MFKQSLDTEFTGCLAKVKSDAEVEKFIDDEGKTGPEARARYELHGIIVRNSFGVFRSRYSSQSGYKVLDFTKQEAHLVNDTVTTREVLQMDLEKLIAFLDSRPLTWLGWLLSKIWWWS